MELDRSTEWGARVERRLADEVMIWLTTVRGDNRPQPSAVWFLWDGESFLIYSRPDMPKLRNIAQHPAVALHFDGDKSGGDLIIFDGDARIVDDAPPVQDMPAYLAKYEDRIRGIGLDATSFGRAYSVAIRVTPRRVRGH